MLLSCYKEFATLKRLVKGFYVKVSVVVGAIALCAVVVVEGDLPLCSGVDDCIVACTQYQHVCTVQQGSGSIVDEIMQVQVCCPRDPRCEACKCVQTNTYEPCARVTPCRHWYAPNDWCWEEKSYRVYHKAVNHGGPCSIDGGKKQGDGS